MIDITPNEHEFWYAGVLYTGTKLEIKRAIAQRLQGASRTVALGTQYFPKRIPKQK